MLKKLSFSFEHPIFFERYISLGLKSDRMDARIRGYNVEINDQYERQVARLFRFWASIGFRSRPSSPSSFPLLKSHPFLIDRPRSKFFSNFSILKFLSKFIHLAWWISSPPFFFNLLLLKSARTLYTNHYIKKKKTSQNYRKKFIIYNSVSTFHVSM